MEKVKLAGFLVSMIPNVVGELVLDSIVWLDTKVDNALDVWD